MLLLILCHRVRKKQAFVLCVCESQSMCFSVCVGWLGHDGGVRLFSCMFFGVGVSVNFLCVLCIDLRMCPCACLCFLSCALCVFKIQFLRLFATFPLLFYVSLGMRFACPAHVSGYATETELLGFPTKFIRKLIGLPTNLKVSHANVTCWEECTPTTPRYLQKPIHTAHLGSNDTVKY